MTKRTTAARKAAFHDGLSAEDAVVRHYHEQGAVLREKRWRGRAGEIDLILDENDTVVFVEVKKRQSHGAALMSLAARQVMRILRSAEDYLGTCPGGLLTDARFDVATVDAQGQVRVLRNASMAV